jgi:hypothetical protein
VMNERLGRGIDARKLPGPVGKEESGV